jgi:hypothetical protein
MSRPTFRTSATLAGFTFADHLPGVVDLIGRLEGQVDISK